MHIAHVKEPTKWANGLLNPGSYWLEDHNAAELLWKGRCLGSIVLQHDIPEEPDPLDTLQPGDEIQVVRVGGFGDLLWMNAIYAEIRRRFPGIKIAHSCFPRYASVLLGFADRVLPYPFPSPENGAERRVWWLENIIEGEACMSEHPADRIARRFGLGPLERKSAYHLSDKERSKGYKRWRRRDKKVPRIAVQTSSATDNKSYPHIGKVMATLHSMGCEILLVGNPIKSAQKVPERIYCGPDRGLNIRESIAMVAHCDAIVAADSVFVHVGAALDVPVVGLFGPFHGESYMSGQRGVALQGRAACSPCSWHPRGSEFPEGKPCERAGHCTALAEVQPMEVVQTVLKLIQ